MDETKGDILSVQKVWCWEAEIDFEGDGINVTQQCVSGDI